MLAAAGAFALGSAVGLYFARLQRQRRRQPIDAYRGDDYTSLDPTTYFEQCRQQYDDMKLLYQPQSRGAASASSLAAADVPPSAALPSPSPPAALSLPSNVYVRPATLADLDAIAQLHFDAFNQFNLTVGLPPDWPTLEYCRDSIKHCIQHDYSLVAVRRNCALNATNSSNSSGGGGDDGEDEEIIASVFNNEENIGDSGGLVTGGPYAVRWGIQSSGIGRVLISMITSHSLAHGAQSIRIVQILPNTASFALYTSLGFESKELLVGCEGYMTDAAMRFERARAEQIGLQVRMMTLQDVEACDELHVKCNGVSRFSSLRNALKEDNADEPSRMMVCTDGKGRILSVSTQTSSLRGATVSCYARRCLTCCGRCIMCVLLLCSAFTSGIREFEFTVARSFDALRCLWSVAFAHHLQQDPERKSPPYIHVCARLYPQLVRWVQRTGVRIHRPLCMQVLGEWKPIDHQQFIYCPSICY